MRSKKYSERVQTTKDHENFTERLRGTSQAAENVLENESEESPERHIDAAIGAVAEVAQVAFEKVQAELGAGAKAADETIRKYPYPSLGVAFAVGLVAAYLLKKE